MNAVDIGKVQFEAGDPCRPRYVDLYRDPADEQWLQLEPAFQVWDPIYELRVRVELAEGDVEITDEDGRPLCRELNVPEARPEIRYDGPRACVLTWSRVEPIVDATRVFRIYCHRRGVKPEEETKEVMVYGGIFVAVTTRLSALHSHIPVRHLDAVRLWNIVVIGTDDYGRPLYDIFKPFEDTGAILPDGVELAPAYLTRKGQALDFVMTMGIEHAVWTGEVEYIQPKDRKPGALHGRYHPEHPKKYYFSWQTDDPEQEPGFRGEIATFHLQATLEEHAEKLQFPEWLRRAGFKDWHAYLLVLKNVNADPTVIQPPPCDPVYKVCAD
jgi:hypothetical protein